MSNKFLPVTYHEGTEGGGEVELYFFFNLGVIWDVWLTPRTDRCTHGNDPFFRFIGPWVGPRHRVHSCGKSRHQMESTPGPTSL